MKEGKYPGRRVMIPSSVALKKTESATNTGFTPSLEFCSLALNCVDMTSRASPTNQPSSETDPNMYLLLTCNQRNRKSEKAKIKMPALATIARFESL